MNRTTYVATPSARWRITPLDGLNYRYILVEMWWPRDDVWLVAAHIPLPDDLTEHEINAAVDDAVNLYLEVS